MFGSIKTLTSGDFGNMRAECTVQWRTSTVTRELNFTPTQHSTPSQYNPHSPLMHQPSWWKWHCELLWACVWTSGPLVCGQMVSWWTIWCQSHLDTLCEILPFLATLINTRAVASIYKYTYVFHFLHPRHWDSIWQSLMVKTVWQDRKFHRHYSADNSSSTSTNTIKSLSVSS